MAFKLTVFFTLLVVSTSTLAARRSGDDPKSGDSASDEATGRVGGRCEDDSDCPSSACCVPAARAETPVYYTTYRGTMMVKEATGFCQKRISIGGGCLPDILFKTFPQMRQAYRFCGCANGLDCLRASSIEAAANHPGYVCSLPELRIWDDIEQQ